ncbi:NAD-dependent epimerase/dehydratase family protein [Metasolibacillus meyeri]|uniref:NAD-dependent epimerase/dehydratase family protein n=1 Tax=Metasolibacillus meyeri TaxID=1071052 RepID=UPI000D309CE7|nr:NAD-dependent epimerase/dehydratase family protein [Metasolibacillus meyeri]
MLITGREGYIGGELYKQLQNQHEIYEKRIELLDYQEIENFIKKFHPEVVVHCAGASSVAMSFEKPSEDFEKNVLTTKNILEALRLHSPKTHFIYLSSAAVYGNPIDDPITEESAVSPISPYGYSKVCSEYLIKQYNEVFQVPTSVLRIFSVYGQGMTKQVIYDIFEKFSDKSMDVVYLFGTGQETRDFIHVYDLCNIIELIIEKNIHGILNVASGESISIKDIANLIKQEMQSDKPIVFQGDARIGDPINWHVNINNLKKIGFEQKITIQEGLKYYHEWYK